MTGATKTIGGLSVTDYYYYYQSIYIVPHEERSALQKRKNEKQRTKIMETSEFSATS